MTRAPRFPQRLAALVAAVTLVGTGLAIHAHGGSPSADPSVAASRLSLHDVDAATDCSLCPARSQARAALADASPAAFSDSGPPRLRGPRREPLFAIADARGPASPRAPPFRSA